MSLTTILVNNLDADTLYLIIQDQNGDTWNGTALEDYNASNYLTYDIALSSIAGILYGVTIPTLLPADTYTISIKIQAGGSPNVSDAVLETRTITWNGSVVAINQTLGGAYENIRVLINNVDAYVLYLNIQDQNGKIWDGDELVTYNVSNFSTYSFYLGKITDILYGINFPVNLDVGDYVITIRRRSGASLNAATDPVVDTRFITWNGIEETDTTIYQTIEQAQEYFDTILETSAWDDSDNTRRLKALKEATRILDRLPLDDDYIFADKQDADIPNAIKYACNEIAYALLDGKDINKEFELLGINSTTFSNTRVSYKDNYMPEYALAGVPSFRAWMYIKPYLKDFLTLRLERVN